MSFSMLLGRLKCDSETLLCLGDVIKQISTGVLQSSFKEFTSLLERKHHRSQLLLLWMKIRFSSVECIRFSWTASPSYS